MLRAGIVLGRVVRIEAGALAVWTELLLEQDVSFTQTVGD